MQIAFTKMHGLGNDFVVVDMVTQHAELAPERIAAMADRHTGIGFDQLLALEPPDEPDADFRYRIYNADGSEAEQCGNGARCVARFARDRGLSLKPSLVLQTLRGRIVCHLGEDENVEVDMGEPDFDPGRLPCLGAGPLQLTEGGAEVDWNGERIDLALVSMGNPHAVVFVDDITRAPVDTLGPFIQQLDAFPESVNVGFCQAVDRQFGRLRVYERGIGETRACGSGACAAAAAGIRRGLFDARVKLSLPGGKLRLSWQGSGHPIRMAGATSVVFEGRIDL